LYFAFLFFCSLSLFTAKNKSLAIVSFTELLVVFSISINLLLLLQNKLHLLYKILFIVSFFAFLQSFQALYYFIKTINTPFFLEAFANLKGNTGSINILGASLTIKIPFLLITIIYYSGWKKYFSLLTLFTVTTVIFLTGARTPLINMCLLFFVFFFYILKTEAPKKLRLINCAILLLPLLISIFAVTVIFKKYNISNRYSSISGRLTQINPEEQSAAMRLTYWNNAFEIAEKNPVFGIGLGNYRIESIAYETKKTNDTLISLHTHNDFLEILAETGIINGSIYLLLFGMLFSINLKKIVTSETPNQKNIAILSLLLTIIYGVDSFFNFPMFRPTVQIFFALCIALTLLNTTEIETTKEGTYTKNTTLLLILLAIFTTYFTFFTFQTSQLEAAIKKDHIDGRAKGKLSGKKILNQNQKYPNVFSSSESFLEYEGIYFFREQNYTMALQQLTQARKINPYLGRVDFYTHCVFKTMKNKDSAYYYAKKALAQCPKNQFYFETIQSNARNSKDIFENHKTFTQHQKMAVNWLISSQGLQKLNYPDEKIISFLDLGLKEFPKDLELQKRKNMFLKRKKQ
jgi:O-antigen ligase